MSDERPEPEQTKNGDWFVEVYKDNGYYEIFNVGPDDALRFYMVRAGQYGNPIIIAEPDLAFDVPSTLHCFNSKNEKVVPDQKIAGIICKDGPRLSLTNAKKQGIVVMAHPDGDGSLQIGEEKWWIRTLLLKDKNRIFNYDAFCIRDGEPRNGATMLLELGDLDLFYSYPDM